MSPTKNLSEIFFFLFERAQLRFFKLGAYLFFLSKILKLIPLSSTLKISAFFQFNVGSSLKFLSFFSQFVSLNLLVIAPLQPCRLSYASIPFLREIMA